MALFVLEDLAALVQGDLDTASATVCRAVAEGLVSAAAGAPVGDPPEPVHTSVGLLVAARLYRNPELLSQEMIGARSWQVAYREFLTPGEIAACRSAPVGRGAFTIRPTAAAEAEWATV